MQRRGLAGRLTTIALLPWLALAAACGRGRYPLDEQLTLQHVQMKGTHNSYHVAQQPPPLLDWSYTHAPLEEQLEHQGVRQVELDIHHRPGAPPGSRFAVHHLDDLDTGTTCLLLADCLGALSRWSHRSPGHHPVVVLIEPKDELDSSRAGAFFDDLEAEILAAFPRDRLITPDLVQGAFPELRAAVRERGWPPLALVRGRALFVLLDHGEYRKVYTRGGASLAGRLMFVSSSPGDPFAAVLALDDPFEDGAAIKRAVAEGFLVRTRADSGTTEPRHADRRRLQAALESGAQMISTDYPAAVAGIDYRVDLPGGRPSRCNPLTAPPRCTAAAVEDPGLIR